MISKVFFSPLEQFEVYPLISIYISNLDFSITNHTVVLFVVFLFFYIVFSSMVNEKNKSLLIIPNRWQSFLELLYMSILKIVFDNMSRKEGQYFFPFIFSMFLFVLCLNLIGLIPYSPTLTAQFIVTFTLSLVVFLGINVICVRTHGVSYFTLFLPAGSEGALALILVPIEFISYFFKPISLSLRLFANMMAGHALLKIIAGICWSLAGCTGILFLMQYVPMLILVFLVILELAIALIQAIVFSTLVTTYIHDVIFLH